MVAYDVAHLEKGHCTWLGGVRGDLALGRAAERVHQALLAVVGYKLELVADCARLGGQLKDPRAGLPATSSKGAVLSPRTAPAARALVRLSLDSLSIFA